MSEYRIHQKVGMLEDTLVGKNEKIHEQDLLIVLLKNELSYLCGQESINVETRKRIQALLDT